MIELRSDFFLKQILLCFYWSFEKQLPVVTCYIIECMIPANYKIKKTTKSYELKVMCGAAFKLGFNAGFSFMRDDIEGVRNKPGRKPCCRDLIFNFDFHWLIINAVNSRANG